jgi:hypothetical protein
MKLGKLAVRQDARTLKLASYTGKLDAAPGICDPRARLGPLGMMRNDALGDCTCATVGHIIQSWTAQNGHQVDVPDQDIVDMYSAVSGYQPGRPETDRGAVVLDVLNHWRKSPLVGHELLAYTSLHPRHTMETRQAIYYFGAAYLGILLPLTAQDQSVWTVTGLGGDGEPGSWGGHAVPAVAYDRHWIWCVTWGEVKKMSWNFFYAYCDEAYALLGRDWFATDDRCPAGFDLAQLQVDLSTITA